SERWTLPCLPVRFLADLCLVFAVPRPEAAVAKLLLRDPTRSNVRHDRETLALLPPPGGIEITTPYHRDHAESAVETAEDSRSYSASAHPRPLSSEEHPPCTTGNAVSRSSNCWW